MTLIEVRITICSIEKKFIEKGKGGIEVPALEKAGFPGVKGFFKFGETIFIQLTLGEDLSANSVTQIPVGGDWEEPYSLLLECQGVTWRYLASNRDHLILLGPKDLHQGIFSQKQSLWSKASMDELLKKKY